MSVLAGKRILLVEDEALIAVTVEQMLGDSGAEVVGTAATLDEALALCAGAACDAAVLDVNLGGALVFPAADVLARRGIPVVFATGYGGSAIGPQHRGEVIEKPYTRDKLVRALVAALLSGRHSREGGYPALA
jgi:CheY-like chemotaxis protein